MSAVTVDASVWIASQDMNDACCAPSRAFLSGVVTGGTTIHVPAYARVEVACALARKLRRAAKGQRLVDQVMEAANVQVTNVNDALLASALSVGTSKFLRAADALYAATAELTGSTLISWDKEHLLRVGGVTPSAWLASNP
jgi:predicted nucleic acid-binding protein